MTQSGLHPLKATPGSKGYSQYNGHTSGPGQIKWKINQKGMNLGKEQVAMRMRSSWQGSKKDERVIMVIWETTKKQSEGKSITCYLKGCFQNNRVRFLLDIQSICH